MVDTKEFDRGEYNLLVAEFIDRLRSLFAESGFRTIFDEHGGKIFIKLVKLAKLVDWANRYSPRLGKLKAFIESNEECRHFLCLEDITPDVDSLAPPSFAVRQVTQPHLSRDVAYAAPIPSDRIAPGLDSAIGEGADSDDDIVSVGVSSFQEDSRRNLPDFDEDLSSKAAVAVRSTLETSHESDPPQTMKLSLAGIMIEWNRTYKASLGKMKEWLLTRKSDEFYIQGNHGNEIVGFVSNGISPILATIRENEQPTCARGQVGAGGRPTVEAGEDIGGVSVHDFFNIPQQTDMTQRAYNAAMQRLHLTIAGFVQVGIIQECLSYGTHSFEGLEWVGDAVLHLELSRLLLNSQHELLGVGGLTGRRQDSEQRLTLALLFDDLQLARFVKVAPSSWTTGNWKCKGDFLEALIGELHQKLESSDENSVHFNHPERKNVVRLIRCIVQGALDRGARLKSSDLRSDIEARATAAGGGGLRITQLDIEASMRNNR